MNWISFGMTLVPAIIKAVRGVEAIFQGKGKDKQDAAIKLVNLLVEDAEGFTGKDLLKNEKVEKAARNAIDAIVAVENAVAEAKAAKN